MKFKMIVFVIVFMLLNGQAFAQGRNGEAAAFTLKTEADETYPFSSLPEGRYRAAPSLADYAPFRAYAPRQASQADQNVEAAKGWEIQTPDPDLATGQLGNSIAVDAQGRPRISYEFTRDFSRYDIRLRYAEWTGARWDIQTVHGGIAGLPGGYHSSLALDAQGKPHITYHMEEAGGWRPIFLRHATRGFGWWSETLDEFPTFAQFYDSSAAVDSHNRLNVLYTSRTAGFSGLRYAIVGGSNRLIEPGFVHLTHNSLALSALGRPHVAYHAFTETGDALKYATRVSSNWQTTVIDENLGTYGECAIAVDAQGQPHIAYVDPQGDRVKYAVWNGTAWDIEIVGTDSELNQSWDRSDISLVLGPGGTPHILYVGADLKYATKNNGVWEVSVLYPGPIGYYSDLALDAQGYLHASFFDWQDSRLKYARSTFSVNPRFQVTAPQAGDTWVAGSTYTIAWQADYMPEGAWVGGVRLWWDTLPVAEILPPQQQSPATGSIQWRVPDNIPPGDYYLVEAILNQGVPGSQTQITDAWSGPFRLRRP